MRCPSGSGWGKALVVSNRNARRREGESHPGPWPVKPRLGLRRFVPGLLIRGERGATPPGPQTRGQPPGRRPGIEGSAARARGLFWLQKSTSGAWPKRKRKGSSSPALEGKPPGCTRSERAPEAGSRRRSRENGGGLSQEGTRRWKALWSDEVVVFDETAAQADLAPRGYRALARSKRGATESVRGRVTSSARGRQHRGRAASFGGAADRSIRQDRPMPPPREARGFTATNLRCEGRDHYRSWRIAVKRSSTRSSRPRLTPPRDLSLARDRKVARGAEHDPGIESSVGVLVT